MHEFVVHGAEVIVVRSDVSSPRNGHALSNAVLIEETCSKCFQQTKPCLRGNGILLSVRSAFHIDFTLEVVRYSSA